LAAGLVVLVVLAWALWQFPFLVPPELDIAEAATDASILRPLLWAFLAGGAILVLPLAALFYVFKRPYL
jgi:cytochrome d ubiquinol oxidase subunit II